ncbi:hypothetical protein [Streptomyces longwoodensis]|uniref:Uncharacterized protein n=1 Tax=Streptomyces longwoodensis TaxID=68231 RepID=A0A101QRQ5_9ACTN|nr:hypothetical protein [Streptomyces longwoodensis]KUN34840.1 hypothetical protein AQJ30_27620 [Streptomyces longwoodensis]
MSTPQEIVFEPGKFYDVTVKDVTEACVNFNETFDVPELYSNAGTNVNVTCGRCKKPMVIISATLLDPQPEMP